MLELLDNAVNEFKKLDDEVIRIISHIDSDGITAASVMIKSFEKEGKKFVLSNVKQLNQEIIEELNNEPYNVIFFLDMGSGNLSLIKDNLGNKKIFVFDHHVPEDTETNFIHVNPHLTNLEDASEQISSSGITYLFCKKLNKENKNLAYLALIGATGDIQKFDGLNKEILEDAVESDKIEVKKGLKIFGTQTKPLHKMLQYSTYTYIPGVTGSEEDAIKFLEDTKIKFRDGNKIKRLIDLNEEDVKKLISAIILKRMGKEENPEDVIGNLYLIKDEKEGSYLKDLREFSTLLNCCGRLGQTSLGIGVCLENKNLKEKAEELLMQYKSEIIKGLDWFYENKDKFLESEDFIVINSKDKIRDTLIGVIAGIISKSNVYKDGKIIIAMAYTSEEDIKISIRVSGDGKNIDLREILKNLVEGIGQFGGHKLACGATIPLNKEEIFLERTVKLLKRVSSKVY